ncbi:HNH endonuclease [Streptomyces sp. NPDC002812]|uniref:HNH endonuclease n=1 Tax=Streptomyces sp. NPDC002812 TaxID=3154434 RepID=UPI00331F05C8
MIKNFSRGLAPAALAFAVLAPAAAHADEYALTDAITSLPVAAEVRDGYRRELCPHWKDDDKNGCSARNDVLIEEAIEAPTVGAGCTITGGAWHSYYDDVVIYVPAGIDIDRPIPFAELHYSGGYGWTTERRRRYANDLGSDITLVGVTARSNRQKSDQDPATWMLAPGVHCRYIGEWVATKHRWALSVDQAEREALLRPSGSGCPCG